DRRTPRLPGLWRRQRYLSHRRPAAPAPSPFPAARRQPAIVSSTFRKSARPFLARKRGPFRGLEPHLDSNRDEQFLAVRYAAIGRQPRLDSFQDLHEFVKVTTGQRFWRMVSLRSHPVTLPNFASHQGPSEAMVHCCTCTHVPCFVAPTTFASPRGSLCTLRLVCNSIWVRPSAPGPGTASS